MLSPVVWIALILLALFLLLGVLVWIVPRLFRIRPRASRIARVLGAAYCATLLLTVTLILPLVASYLISHASTRPQDRRLTDTPASYGRPYRSVEFPSRDGLKLSGWYLGGTLSQALVWTHGLFRDRHEVLRRACRLNELGHPVLLYDLRSQGESETAIITLGWKERLDVRGAFDFLHQQQPAASIGLVGVSMGAVAELMAAAEIPRQVACVVAESPFNSLDDTVRRHVGLFLKLPTFPFADLFIWNLTRIGGFEARQLDLLRAAEALKSTPVLLIYGGADERMPPAAGRRLYAALESSRSRFEVFETAGHGHAFETEPDRYVNLIHEYVQKAAEGP